MQISKAPFPHPATLITVAIGLFIQIAWAYVQIRHWKEPGADSMGIALNIIITACLWVILMLAVWRFWIATPKRMENLSDKRYEPKTDLDISTFVSTT